MDALVLCTFCIIFLFEISIDCFDTTETKARIRTEILPAKHWVDVLVNYKTNSLYLCVYVTANLRN